MWESWNLRKNKKIYSCIFLKSLSLIWCIPKLMIFKFTLLTYSLRRSKSLKYLFELAKNYKYRFSRWNCYEILIKSWWHYLNPEMEHYTEILFGDMLLVPFFIIFRWCTMWFCLTSSRMCTKFLANRITWYILIRSIK